MDPLNDVTLTVNQTFPKGMALAQWLNGPVVNASPTLGQLAVSGSEHSVNTVNAAHDASGCTTRRRARPQYLSFNTPVGTPEAMQCGKVVFTDIHIQKSISVGGVTTGGDDSDPSKPFPSGCKTNMMSPQAKALEFLFFDLTSCVEPPTTMPQPPTARRRPARRTGPPPSTSKPPAVPPPPPPPPPPIQDDGPLSAELRVDAASRRRRSGEESLGSCGGRGLASPCASRASGSVNENVAPPSVGLSTQNRAALRLDQALRDVEAQAPALARRSPPPARSVRRCAGARWRRSRDRCRDGQQRLRRRAARRDGDRTAVGRELDRVADQVRQHLDDAIAIAAHDHAVRRGVEPERDALLGRQRRQRSTRHVVEQLPDVVIARLHGEAAGVQAGDVQQVVDHVAHLLRAAADALELLPPLAAFFAACAAFSSVSVVSRMPISGLRRSCETNDSTSSRARIAGCARS